MNLELIYDEKEKVWKERPEFFTTIAVKTKEGFKFLQKAIERARPEKPFDVETHYLPETYDFDYAVAKCPSCGERITFDEYYRPKFCWECGQALDWEDGE